MSRAFRLVMVDDPAQHVAANEQKLREPNQVFEGRVIDAAKLETSIIDFRFAAAIRPLV